MPQRVEPHQVHSVKPDSQRCARLLEDRPGQRIDVIPARLASVGRAALHAVVLARFLALVADLHAAGEALVFDLLKAGIVGRKVFVELPEGVAKLGGGDGLSAIHADTMPFVPPCCQGIITNPTSCDGQPLLRKRERADSPYARELT